MFAESRSHAFDPRLGALVVHRGEDRSRAEDILVLGHLRPLLVRFVRHGEIGVVGVVETDDPRDIDT